MLIVHDSFDTDVIYAGFRLDFNTTCIENVKIQKELTEIVLFYSNALKKTSSELSAASDSLGMSVYVGGNDPLFVLLTIVDRLELGVCGNNEALRELQASSEKCKSENGFLRVGNALNNLYFEHFQDLDEKLETFKNLEDSPEMSEKSFVFEKTNKIDMIVQGTNDPTHFISCFERITNLISEKPRKEVQLLDKYKVKEPLNKIYNLSPDSCILNQNIVGRKLIKAKDRSTCLYFKFGSDIKSDAISRVLENSLHEKFFHKLRTEEGGDYVVYVGRQVCYRSFEVSFNIQSNKPVLAKILKFIDETKLELGNKDALINTFIGEKSSRQQLVNGYFYLARMGIEIENRKQNLKEAILGLTVEDLKDALRNAEIILVESEPYEEHPSQ